MILQVVKDRILQISLKTKEITTSYEIEPFKFSDAEYNIIKICNGPAKIISFHNYNEKEQCLKEIVLFKNNLNNKIYIYNWDENTLIEKENYETLNLVDLTELNTIKNNNNGKKVFIHEDKLIIFK